MADRPLHVLVVGMKWPPETFLRRLCDGLLDAGFAITVATSTRPDDAWLARRGAYWLPAPDWTGPPPQRLLRLGTMALAALRRSRSDTLRFAGASAQEQGWGERLQSWNRLLPYAGRRWDAVYFPWNTGAIAYLPLFDLGMPVVVSCRGAHVNIAPHNPNRAAIGKGLRTTFARAAAVHCVSADIRDEAQPYGLETPKSWVIRPAVDPEFFVPATEPRRSSERLTIVTTGSLIWRKGYEYALLAIRQLVDSGVPVQFDIIGSGPERERLLYTIDDLRLTANVQLMGRLSPQEVRDRLQGADLFLLASLSEGISNAVLEAMACGLPVVTSDCGGMREAVSDGVEGFVVPVRAAAAMADALARLAHDPALRERMGAAGRRRVEQEFVLAGQIANFVRLFGYVTAPANGDAP